MTWLILDLIIIGEAKIICVPPHTNCFVSLRLRIIGLYYPWLHRHLHGNIQPGFRTSLQCVIGIVGPAILMKLQECPRLKKPKDKFALLISRYLGLMSSAYHTTMDNARMNYRSKCYALDVLAPKQRELCGKSKNVLDIISTGASMGIEECQYQFSDRRWNCTTFNNTSVFGKVLDKSKSVLREVFMVITANTAFRYS